MVDVLSLVQTVAERDMGADQPGVVKVLVDLGDAASVLRVHCEHLVEEGEKLGREGLPHARGLDGYTRLPLNEFIVVWVTQCGLLPGKAASQHAEEENTY